MECTLNLADGCNLQCTYCYEGNEKRNSVLSEEVMREAIDFMVENNPKEEKIHLSLLGGEPLLNKKVLLRLFDYIDDKYREIKQRFEFEMTTNGILLDDRIMEIVRNNNFKLYVSIDGDRETHNLNRSSGNKRNYYDTILRNLQKLIEQKVQFGVRMTVTCNNVHIFHQNVLYFYEMGVKRVHAAYDDFGAWTRETLNLLDEQMELLDEYYLNSVANTQDRLFNLHDLKLTTFFASRKPLFCSAGSIGHFTVNSSGDIFPCGYVLNDMKWNIGNFQEGIDRTKLISCIKASVKPSNKCNDCDIAFTCSGRKCGFQNYRLTGSLNIPSDITCKLERILYKHNYQVIKKMYERKIPRLMRYFEIAEANQIKIGKTMESIIREAAAAKS
ncbi:MAG: radical SAM/SPASM domain-containing protein [Paenibacillus macerans]|uniref:Radical SAM additional 4Fe4S-binding SPASM domain protein n=1 Tax=Paenibacillus macerans TaxID=44252 RepID=A0A090Y7G4_PAEMA|nr:radical SAM/SPASM domain-containing protein [Paenibacillus macerans]KFM94404.1 radical SAM additional 4Fe4S-binding SPASM domain protein [Paenibacillus macerans]MBS5909594.1 radical SAM/SPASM domain-containing protein [Paenibacillus macerans]MCY7557258.1 radical SAM/SPASM domain-containing protein [Paenibacillus macerans]MDU5947821.1 radical SAM/SPASM domain-containing protein [Paenibacillus macerans]MDU7471817.1 radical SAM/SPASM domain-containing protein [Paenibacillus macerans]